ncbi:hypothetical protein NDU88_002927 [Pleurodeles waltl]|uniref:Uncharacterized protein n=1 Tax=Pleurodeles waltl TaxID=8319 RepID=A0AAV7UZ75_PLEWA|nr:hypothetical protein NDU88_002927 [Pleurodeles waltl]
MNGSPVSPDRREPDGPGFPGAEDSHGSRASGSRLLFSDLSSTRRRACLLPCRKGWGGGRERGEQAIHRWGADRVSTAPLQISSLTHRPPALSSRGLAIRKSACGRASPSYAMAEDSSMRRPHTVREPPGAVPSAPTLL